MSVTSGWNLPRHSTLDARIGDLGGRLTKHTSRYLLIKIYLTIDLWKMDMLYVKIEAEIYG